MDPMGGSFGVQRACSKIDQREAAIAWCAEIDAGLQSGGRCRSSTRKDKLTA
jgi:hypothetical protein